MQRQILRLRMRCNFKGSAVRKLLLPFVVAAALAAVPAWAEDPATFTIRMKGRAFDPARLVVPAGVRIVLQVKNDEDATVEFESETLKVERIITAGRTGTIRLAPLEPGEYPFTDDFHREATGVLVVEGKK